MLCGCAVARQHTAALCAGVYLRKMIHICSSGFAVNYESAECVLSVLLYLLLKLVSHCKQLYFFHSLFVCFSSFLPFFLVTFVYFLFLFLPCFVNVFLCLLFQLKIMNCLISEDSVWTGSDYRFV